MPKNVYVGVDGIARLVNNIYVGVDGKARKVTKAYIGVDGIARVFFDGGSIPYYAFLYDDGTLVIQDNEIPDANKTLVNTYFPMKKSYSANKTPWNTQVLNIQNVIINSPIEADMSNYFYNAQNLKNIQQENFITTKMINTYYNCINLTGAPVCGNNVVNMYRTYYNCTNLTGSPICGENVINMSYTYCNCTNLTGSPVCGNNVVNMEGTYWDCKNLTGSPICGENVIDMYRTYYNCTNLTGSPVCGNNVTNMYGTYWNCCNLTGPPVCGKNVTDMQDAYWNCSNLTGSPVCGNKVYSMYSTYINCKNLIGSPVCGPNVTTMECTYVGCSNLTGSPVFGNKVNYIGGTYAFCTNLTGSPVCSPNATSMSGFYYRGFITMTVGTYENCFNLTGSPVCGKNVTNMYKTYSNCYNLTGSPACGENVTNMRETYRGCKNLTGSPVCGNKVTDMYDTYMASGVTGSPVCGNNVVYLSGTYSDCSNLIGAPVCGSNVQYMNFAYHSCQNLYGNSYFYSPKVQNVTSCFGNRNTSNRLNIYTLLNSTTMSTLLQNNASSLVGTSITWIDDMAENNRYYNNEYNIYIYPVDNVQEACLINRDCDFEGEIYLSNVKDVKMLLNENKSNKMVYVVKDESLQPIITVESSNTDIVTVSNVTFNNNKLYYNINSTNLEGSSIITIKIEAGNFSLIKTYNIKVYETFPVEYNIETIEGVTYGFELNKNEYYESTNRGISGSYSMCKLNIITSKDIHLYLDCINNGESGWDFGILSELNTTLNLDNNEDTSNVFKSFKNLSNTDIQTVDYGIISSGEYYIYIKYKKDGSADNGNDSLQFKVRIIEE